MAELTPTGSNQSAALTAEFLRISRLQLQERPRRIEACLQKLTLDQIWSREHEIENAIGNLILHLCGNIRQWIVSGVGGAPDQRKRGAEFAHRAPLAADELLARLRDTVEEADAVLAGLRTSDLLRKRRIQGYDVTVLHAIHHVTEHLAEHTGQIIWATKRITGEDLGFYRHLTDEGVDGSAGQRQP